VKDYSKIIGKITSTPWMITPDALKMMLEIFDAHLDGRITHEEIQARLADAQMRGDDSRTSRSGSIGVMPLQGPIFPKANLMTELSGATSLEQFRSEFRAMLGDDSISAILLDVDSPGGLSDLVEETATEIREARDVKPIYAIANTAANSAAYYLASQATKMFASPSAQLGSIGTFIVHEDDSLQRQSQGLKDTVIKAGRFKAISEEPLTGEGKSYLQGLVDETNDGFVRNVALGRGMEEDTVRGFADGRIFHSRSSLALGMIDGIASYDDVLASMTADFGGPSIDALSAQAMGKTMAQLGMAGLAASNTAVRSFTMRHSYDADKEHSEPGTGQGGEPEPREPPEKDDKAIEGGWRRDPPPVAFEEEEQQTGGMVMNRERLEALAATLGIEVPDDTDDEALADLVDSRVGEIVTPLNAAVQEAEAHRSFERDYPEKAAELERLGIRDREGEARAFAATYESFDEDSKKGFSNVVLNQIEDCHLKISEKRIKHEDLKELLDSCSAKAAVVTYGEQGSARPRPEAESIRPGASPADVRKQLHELVESRMTEDSMSYEDALAVVTRENPDLTLAYARS
jgi:signal peptide peptidase SppA